MLKAAQKYLATQVTTTDQGQLLILLYDAAIKFLNQAKTKIDEKDYAQKGILIAKALDILSELGSSLNKDKGGELADSLNQLYFYCNTRLLMANLKMDKAIIDEVVKIISGVRDAYSQIIKEGAVAPETPMDKAGTRAVSRSASFGAPRIPGAATTPPPVAPAAAKAGYAQAVAQARQNEPKTRPSQQPDQPAPQAGSPAGQPQATPASRTLAEPAPAHPGASGGAADPSTDNALRRRMVQAYGSTPK